MTIDNQVLYLGFGENWNEVITNNKAPIQREIFCYGLILILFGLNVFERILTEYPNWKNRAIKSTLTVILIYLINWGIFELLDMQIYCLYYSPRGAPAPSFCLATLAYLAIALLIFEVCTKSKAYGIIRQILRRVTPNFIEDYYKTAYNKN